MFICAFCGYKSITSALFLFFFHSLCKQFNLPIKLSIDCRGVYRLVVCIIPKHEMESFVYKFRVYEMIANNWFYLGTAIVFGRPWFQVVVLRCISEIISSDSIGCLAAFKVCVKFKIINNNIKTLISCI